MLYLSLQPHSDRNIRYFIYSLSRASCAPRYATTGPGQLVHYCNCQQSSSSSSSKVWRHVCCGCHVRDNADISISLAGAFPLSHSLLSVSLPSRHSWDVSWPQTTFVSAQSASLTRAILLLPQLSPLDAVQFSQIRLSVTHVGCPSENSSYLCRPGITVGSGGMWKISFPTIKSAVSETITDLTATRCALAEAYPVDQKSKPQTFVHSI